MKLKISLLFVIFAFVFPVTASANIIFVDTNFVENDCSIIGTWNILTQTCTMNRDVVGRIVLVDTGTTLDGNGHTLSSNEDTRYGTGVEIFRADRITVKNLHVSDFSSAITAYTPANEPRGDLVTLKDNSITESEKGIDTYRFDRFVVVGNTITSSGVSIGVTDGERGRVADNVIACPSNTCTADISLSLVSSSNIVSNQITGGNIGFDLRNVSDLSFADNTISETLTALSMVANPTTLRNIFSGNTFRDSGTGVKISHDSGGGGPVLSLASKFFDFLVPSALALSDDDNIFFHNDFIHNTRDVLADSSDFFRFSKLAPDGGNFWDKNTDCADTDTDGFCDTPYLVDLGVYDELPLTHSISTITPPPTVLTLENPTETEDDGNQDTKGVAGKTNFTFSVTAENADSVKVIATSTTDTFILNLVQTGDTYTATSTFPKGKYTWHIEASAGGQTVRTPDRNFTTGYSNVAFLPGLEASRLYRAEVLSGKTETQVWEPTLAFHDNSELLLYPDGTPIRTNLYTKDPIDEVLGFNIYESFIDSMNDMVLAGTIHAWKPLPYDWRFDVRDIVDHPIALATTSYSMTEEIQKLADSSDTGKVTLIAHSNGGLVAKVLASKLGADGSKLLDQMIFVASPQVGTPQAVGAILHGYDQGIPKDWLPLLINSKEARDLAVNMPSAYGLLPSAQYFTSVHDPVISFDNNPLLAPWRAKYGITIESGAQLHNFLADQTRSPMPVTEETKDPMMGNPTLLSSAENLHNTILDNWTPPEGVTLTQIAGWGEDTLKSIVYYQGVKTTCVVPLVFFTCTSSPALEYSMKTVLDGDGTVPVPSALWTSGAGRYWVDLQTYNETHFDRKHADILEVEDLRILIRNLMTNAVPIDDTNKDIILTTRPSTTPDKRLHFTLHSPLSLDLYDTLGNHTGISTTTGMLEENIPGSRYRTFGELKYISAPASTTLRLVMNGYATGSFTLDMEEVLGDTVTASTTFAGIPSATSTVATITLPQGNIASASSLVVDENGDGAIDLSIIPKQGGVTLPDFTSPEAVISFSTSTQDVTIYGTDLEGTTTAKTTATSTTITDKGGNTLVIPYIKYKEKPTKLKIVFDTLIYNGVATTTPKTTLEYEWEVNKNGTFKELEQDVRIKNTRRVSAEYEAKKNETKITDRVKEDGEKSTVKITKQGIVSLSLSTRKGAVMVTY